jgi:hypothetical protein
MGQRIAKEVYDSQNNWEKTTFYVRDPQGNVMGIYEKTVDQQTQNLSYKIAERNIYGSSMIGLFKSETELISATAPSTTIFTHEVGEKQFYLSNHLSNVLSVVSDLKVAKDWNADLVVDYYRAEIVSVSDVFPFGSPMNERTINSTAVRHSFNGQEKDDEIYGEGNMMTAEYWQYDARLGRRWNTDPVMKHSQSVYVCLDNSPMIQLDLRGNVAENANESGDKTSEESHEIQPGKSDGKALADENELDAPEPEVSFNQLLEHKEQQVSSINADGLRYKIKIIARHVRQFIYCTKVENEEIATVTQTYQLTGNVQGSPRGETYSPSCGTGGTITSVGYDMVSLYDQINVVDPSTGQTIAATQNGVSPTQGSLNVPGGLSNIQVQVNTTTFYSLTYTVSEQRVFYERNVYIFGMLVKTDINYYSQVESARQIADRSKRNNAIPPSLNLFNQYQSLGGNADLGPHNDVNSFHIILNR